jgi:rRNA processing protein Gar1
LQIDSVLRNALTPSDGSAILLWPIVQHSLNILLFMSDFNNEPRPLAVNVLACSSTGLIHYIQIANEHLSLILPTYNITDGGRQPELLPPLLKTFLESSVYTKIGYGGYEDSVRIKDQYGITIKNIFDIHWMAKVMGIGSSSVGMLHDVFGDVHDVYIPGRNHPDGSHSSQADQEREQQDQTQQRRQQKPQEHGAIIDPRRWDWESHGDLELSRELIRCVAQDAFATLKMYDNIVHQKFKPGYQPATIDPQITVDRARDFLLTSVPRGTVSLVIYDAYFISRMNDLAPKDQLSNDFHVCIARAHQ